MLTFPGVLPVTHVHATMPAVLVVVGPFGVQVTAPAGLTLGPAANNRRVSTGVRTAHQAAVHTASGLAACFAGLGSWHAREQL
jgi:hypothetical protein